MNKVKADNKLETQEIVVIPGMVLRPLNINDAQEYFDVVNMNRDYLSKWVYWTDKVKTLTDSLDLMKKNEKMQSAGTNYRLGIFKDERLIGFVHAMNLLSDEDIEIGYWISEDNQGKGIVTASVKALLEVIEKNFSYKKRVLLTTKVENAASRAVAKKLGFVFKHSFFNTEQQTDEVIYEKDIA